MLEHGTLVVGHNVQFDMRMLKQECGKFDIPLDLEGIETCDTICLARRLRPGMENYRLATLVEALGLDGVNSNDALDDASAYAELFFLLLRDFQRELYT